MTRSLFLSEILHRMTPWPSNRSQLSSHLWFFERYTMSDNYWECKACTFHNPLTAPNCKMCHAARPLVSGGWACSACTFKNPVQVSSCTICNTVRALAYFIFVLMFNVCFIIFVCIQAKTKVEAKRPMPRNSSTVYAIFNDSTVPLEGLDKNSTYEVSFGSSYVLSIL